MRPSILINGSHGFIRADLATGVIIERGECRGCEDCDGASYSNVALCDPVTLAHEAAADPFPETDILAVGYWTPAGDYAEPLTVRRFEYRGEMEFDDWRPLRLLPAPAAARLRSAHVFQDGRDFYVGDADSLETVITAPMRVPDMDIAAAANARDWFVKIGAPQYGISPVWEGETF